MFSFFYFLRIFKSNEGLCFFSIEKYHFDFSCNKNGIRCVSIKYLPKLQKSTPALGFFCNKWDTLLTPHKKNTLTNTVCLVLKRVFTRISSFFFHSKFSGDQLYPRILIVALLFQNSANATSGNTSEYFQI